MGDKIYMIPETIAAYKKMLMHPQEHGLTFKPITECFEKSDVVTANHILAKQYLEWLGRPLPKVILYIVMQQIYGPCNGKDKNQDLGYYLKFVG